MNILKSINREPPTNIVNITMTSESKKIISDQDKAELFRKTYAKTTRKSKTSYFMRSSVKQLQLKVKSYIK